MLARSALARRSIVLLALVGSGCSCAVPDAPDAATPGDAYVAPDAFVDDAGHDAAVDAWALAGSCGAAFELVDPANLDADGVYRLHIESPGRLDESSCPRDGLETERSGVVVRVRASAIGEWHLRSSHRSTTTQQLRTDCADVASELECNTVIHSDQEQLPMKWTATVEGETVDWLLRSRDAVAAFDVEAWPPRLEGDTCAVLGTDASNVTVDCTPPLVCTNWAPTPTCAVNTAPTISRVELYQTDDFYGRVVVWGRDETPSVSMIVGTPSPDLARFDFYVTRPTFDGASFVIDIDNAIRRAPYYDVVVLDGALRSNVVRVEPRARGAGEPCTTFCPTGLACVADAEGTLRCAP